MKVHHLDLFTMCPVGRRFVNGAGSALARGHLVAHALLIETPSDGLVLVDTGVGEADLRDPSGRLGGAFAWFTGAAKGPTRTALAQVRALGFDPRDVRHIVCTHLDLDHAGGLGDFPWATVHVHHRERSTAEGRATLPERERYRPVHFAHGPKWQTFGASGEPWFGFEAARDLKGLPPEILAVPLDGHSRGHACVAVNTRGRWLLHAGDAIFHRSVVEREAPAMPPGLRVFERLVAFDRAKVGANHRRLAALAEAHGEAVTVFAAHDPVQFERMKAQADAQLR
ncbi:MAG: MBL fold metallo-hydrolase [Myxococcales bacterium]|nr:MBL fold metallo-hydrolase [Myxococcales bacterium]